MHYKIKKNGKKKFMKLVPRFPEYLPPTPLDIIFYDKSPDFCVNDAKLGIAGTMGRECNITSSGVDGCDLMCCNRGYTVKLVTEVKQCDCKFIWCCKVQCRRCSAVVPKYICKQGVPGSFVPKYICKPKVALCTWQLESPRQLYVNDITNLFANPNSHFVYI